MSVRIPKKYLKGADDAALWPLYIIGAPASVPELSGYVMKVMQDYTRITDNALLILYGNEWNKKKQQRFYMFEKENKIPGHPSKRYRYTEDEVVRLYGKAESATFDERVEKKGRKPSKKVPEGF